MMELVKQSCRSCGVDYFTSKWNGTWRRVDAATQELILESRPCRCCRGVNVTKPVFDNGGVLVMEEEVSI